MNQPVTLLHCILGEENQEFPRIVGLDGFFKVLLLLFHRFVTADVVFGQEIMLLLIIKHIGI